MIPAEDPLSDESGYIRSLRHARTMRTKPTPPQPVQVPGRQKNPTLYAT